MCGIIGVVHKYMSHECCNLELALETMTLRGPDDYGTWQDEHVALGHRRLSIIGISSGHQPISSPDGSVTVVVNGEFYDYKRIRRELASDYYFQTDTDSEILIPLYLKYGYRKMMKHLRGEFAFILYDKTKGLVIACRDRFGIKPLCWYLDNKQLIIASKAKAIHACGIKAAWDEYSLMQALSIQYQPTNRTFFKGIRQVEPGHMLVSSLSGEIEDIVYWDINYPAYDKDPLTTTAQTRQYIEEFHELLLEAIRLRLQSDVPVCCHLSGGLDSSTVAGIMAYLKKEPIHCFSIVFPHTNVEYNEDAYATETVNKCGAILHRVVVSQNDILSHLSDAVYHSEGLAVNGHLTCKYLLNQTIKKTGFKVALTGEGADECLAGYPHLRKDLFALSPLEEKEALTKMLYDTNLSITGTEIAVGEMLDCHKLSERIGFVPSFLAAKASIGYKMYGLLCKEMLQHCRSHDFLNEMIEHHHADVLFRSAHHVNQSLYLWNKHALCNYILGTLGDGCEMSASVEGRLPFLDHHLFEYAAQLPMTMKIKDKTNEKFVLKEAARPYITDNVYCRQKHPFQAPPLTRYFTPSEFVRIHDELTSASFIRMGIFDRKAITSLLSSLPKMSTLEQTAYEPVVMLMLTIYYINQRLMN